MRRVGSLGLAWLVLIAPAAGRDGKRKVSATKGVQCNGTVRLVLYEALVTVSGRITDSRGRPGAGAWVTVRETVLFFVPPGPYNGGSPSVAADFERGCLAPVGRRPAQVAR